MQDYYPKWVWLLDVKMASYTIGRRLLHANRSSFGMKDWIWGQNNIKIDTVDHTQKNE